ncbi:MAG: NUDIX hydrolase [Alistipes senegalensis]|nr:NUDIX hydrolase [Oxalobacter formigenes]MCM1280796.1 NUDIX hydrolase [Alistipes senegalensis]
MNSSENDTGENVAALAERQLESRVVHQGLFFDVYRDKVLLPDQATSWREYIRHPGAVVVLPVLDDGRLLLERQFRYPLDRVFWELPAGKIDKGEAPLSSAKRELMEETGYTASSWQFVCSIHNAIGYSDEVLYLYLAKGLQPGRQQPDEEEFIETFSADLSQLLLWVKEGKITDAKTMIGVFWMEKIRNGEWKCPEPL